MPSTSTTVKEEAVEERGVANDNIPTSSPPNDRILAFCFGEEEFGFGVEGETKSAFCSRSFVQSKLRHGVPLETIREDLEAYARMLRTEIQKELTDDLQPMAKDMKSHSMQLSSKVNGLQKAVETLERRVDLSSATLRETDRVLDEKMAVVEAAAKQRCAASMQLKARLLFLSVVELRREYTGERRTSRCHLPFRTPISLEERVDAMCSTMTYLQEFHRLLELVPEESVAEQEEGTALPPQLAYREEEETIDQLIHDLVRDICQQLMDDRPHPSTSEDSAPTDVNGNSSSRGLRSNDAVNLLALICQHLPLIYNVDQVKQLCQSAVIKPMVERVIPWTAATTARHNVESTVALLTHFQHALVHDIAPLLPMWHMTVKGERLHPVRSILWPLVFRTLSEKMSHLFDVGLPDAFRSKYLASLSLEETVEGLCASEEERELMRQSPTTMEWRRKWNADIYAAECVMEVTKRVSSSTEEWKQALRSALPLSNLDGVITQLQTVWRTLLQALHAYFSAHFLPAATPTFLRHSISISKSTAATVVSAVSNLLNDRKEANVSTSSGRDSLRVAMCAMLSVSEDVSRLAHYLSTEFRQEVLAAISASGCVEQNVIGAVDLVCNIGTNSLKEEDYRQLSLAVQLWVEQQALLGMQHVKSVRSTYSHTNCPCPSQTSSYVTYVTSPLTLLKESSLLLSQSRAAKDALWTPPGAVPAAGDHCFSLRKHVAVVVMDEFCRLARETLTAAKRADEGWEKLRRKREGAAGGAAAAGTTSKLPSEAMMTDRDKMASQLYLDAKEILRVVYELLPTVGDNAREKLAELQDLMKRGEWVLGGCVGPEPPEVDEAPASPH